MSKTIIILPNFAGGGAEKNLVLLANYMHSKNVDLEIVVFNKVGPTRSLLNPEIAIRELNIRSKKDILFNFFWLGKLLESKSVLTSMFHINLLLCILKNISKYFGRSFYLVIREANTTSAELSGLSWFKRLIYSSLIKFFYPSADKIVAVSNFVKLDLCRNFCIEDTKITVINNALDASVREFDNDLDIVGYSIHQLKLISVGRLVAQKNFFEAIRSVVYILPLKDVSLTIVGDGQYKSQLARYVESLGISHRVFFVEYTSHLRSLMLSHDALLSTSKWEGFPNVFLDALVCGLPVITKKSIGGVSELIQHGVNGVIVDDMNVTTFSEAILLLDEMNFDRRRIEQTTVHFQKDILFKRYYNLVCLRCSVEFIDAE